MKLIKYIIIISFFYSSYTNAETIDCSKLDKLSKEYATCISEKTKKKSKEIKEKIVSKDNKNKANEIKNKFMKGIKKIKKSKTLIDVIK